MSRREFLAALAAAGGSASFSPSAFAGYARGGESPQVFFRNDPKKGFSILQGMTDESSTQFNLVLPKKQKFSFGFSVLEGSGAPLIRHQEIRDRDFSDFAVHRLHVEGLRLGGRYSLKVLNDKSQVLDTREFRALDLSRRAVKFAMISCALDHLGRDAMWNQVYTQKPEMIFFIGDSVYTDRNSLLFKSTPDPEQLWNRFVTTRNRLQLYFQKTLTPILSIWDDHDFGGDNMGTWYPHKEASLLNFETFFAQDPTRRLHAGPGIARKFNAFGADFFLMDGRFFREGGQNRNRQMFGMEQENWLFKHMKPQATFIMNGSMFFGAYTGKDAFEGQFETSFNRFKERLQESQSLVCFGSGDVHFSEYQELEPTLLGYPTFELTSSSIHSSALPGHQNRFKNFRRRAATGSHNFLIFEGEFSEDAIAGLVTSYGVSGVEFRSPVQAGRQNFIG